MKITQYFQFFIISVLMHLIAYYALQHCISGAKNDGKLMGLETNPKDIYL